METASLAASFQSFIPSDNFLPILSLCHLGSPLALIKLSVVPQVGGWK